MNTRTIMVQDPAALINRALDSRPVQTSDSRQRGIRVLGPAELTAALNRLGNRLTVRPYVPSHMEVVKDGAPTSVTTTALAPYPPGHAFLSASDMLRYPYSCIGRMEARPSPTSNYELAGTGVLVGPNLVLSATHLLKERPLSSWEYRFVPGYCDGIQPKAPDGSVLVWSALTGAVVTGDPSGDADHGGVDTVNGWDFAIFELSHRLGDIWGHTGIIWADGSNFYESRPWTSVGYPVAIGGGKKPNIMHGIDISGVDKDDFGSRELETEKFVDGWGPFPDDPTKWRGWSGGPLFTYYEGAWYTAGVMSGWDLDGLDFDGVTVFSGGPRLGAVHDAAWQGWLPYGAPVLFYNGATGQWATGTLNEDAVYQHVFASAPGSMSQWTHIVGAGNGAFIFYNKNNGQWATGTMRMEGSYDHQQTGNPGDFAPWTHIAAGGNGALLWYNAANGQYATGILHASGVYQHVYSSDPGVMSTWTHIVGAGNGSLMFYNRNNGQWATGHLRPDGSYDTREIGQPGDFAAWTHIAGAGKGNLLWYNAANGQYATGNLHQTGAYSHVYSSDPGVMAAWTNIAGASNGSLVFYNEANGQWATGEFAADGSYYTRQIGAPGDFARWTLVAA